MSRSFFSPPPILSSSPPANLPSLQSIEHDSPEDPFSAESDGAGGSAEDEDTRQNTLTNSGNLQSATGGVNVTPANPFKKNLASLGPENIPGPSSLGSQRPSVEAESKTTRAHYDVDGFKRLLMTGEKKLSGANTAVPRPVSFQNLAHGESSSSTDASSLSRQSILESISDPPQESPRTSHESVITDDERQRLVGRIPTAPEKLKPPTPRHRHGKAVIPTPPQTVSFEGPTLSFSDSATSPVVSVDRSVPGTIGDVDKPLPALPPPLNTQPLTQSPVESMNSDRGYPHLNSEDAPSSNPVQNRDPPAPAVSRRHSQPRAKPFTSSSERSAPIIEEAPTGSIPISQTTSNASSKAPPPPPPRRAGLVRGNSSSSLSTGASFTPMSDQSIATDVSTRSAKPRPSVPPDRSLPVSSVKRPNQPQSIPGSPSVAPPPPPRRRGSSQSSYTPSRFNGHHTERLRSDSGASSISHLAMTPASQSSADNKDVMADLSALQREVDELRGKFKD